MKLGGRMGHGPKKNPLNVGSDTKDHLLNISSLFFILHFHQFPRECMDQSGLQD